MIRVLVIFLCLLWAPDVWATTYYTGPAGSDANSCATAQTIGTPKLTIIGGYACLAAGDTLIVRDGTYVEREIVMNTAGTAGNPVTIQAEHNQLAILSSISNGFGGTNPCAPNISFYNSYQVVDGLRGVIDAGDYAGCAGNSAQGAFVRMWSSTTPTISGPSTTGYIGGVVKNSLVDYSSHRGVGIKCNQDSCQIINNTVHTSIELFNGIDQIVSGNYIDKADIFGDHFTVKGGSRNARVSNNHVVQTETFRSFVLGGNTGIAAGVFDTATSIECYNCVGYNNIVEINNATGAPYALALAGCQDCTLFNNVVIGGALNSEQGGIDGPTPYSSGSLVKNNIFSCGATAATNNTTGMTIDYNDFFNCTGTPSQTHPLTSDPLFVSSSDWNLQAGSPSRQAGTTITCNAYTSGSFTCNTDYLGVTRTAPWDQGIYAYASGGGGSVSGPSGLFAPQLKLRR